MENLICFLILLTVLGLAIFLPIAAFGITWIQVIGTVVLFFAPILFFLKAVNLLDKASEKSKENSKK